MNGCCRPCRSRAHFDSFFISATSGTLSRSHSRQDSDAQMSKTQKFALQICERYFLGNPNHQAGHVKIYWKCLRIMAFKVTRWSRWQTILGPLELALLWHRRIPNFHWAQWNYLGVSLRFKIRTLCTTLCPKIKIQVISRLCIPLGWCRSGYEISHLRTR